MVDFKKLFTGFSSLRVGIIGDVMLDTYMWGKVDRISPEAPVPVVTLQNKEYRIGGAGNVALNCRSLDAQAGAGKWRGTRRGAVRFHFDRQIRAAGNRVRHGAAPGKAASAFGRCLGRVVFEQLERSC